MKKIPVYIISGFLGSGKTTFLKRIIEKYAENSIIGIVQNEFGPANIDGIELKELNRNFQMLEIKNGSVFCDCLQGDFVVKLNKFIDDYKPGILIIEASGLSDTSSISEVLSTGKLEDKIVLGTNFCIVDALNFSKVGLMKQRVIHQLRMADVVIINKSDLYKKKLNFLRDEIVQINPFAKIEESSFCNIEFEFGSRDMEKRYYTTTNALKRPDIYSMVIKTQKKVSLASLEQFLSNWAPKAYRIKGYVNLTNGKTVAIQCIMDSVEIKYAERLFHPSELVAITKDFTLREWNSAFKTLK